MGVLLQLFLVDVKNNFEWKSVRSGQSRRYGIEKYLLSLWKISFASGVVGGQLGKKC